MPNGPRGSGRDGVRVLPHRRAVRGCHEGQGDRRDRGTEREQSATNEPSTRSLARPDAPVTLPILEDNAPISDRRNVEGGPLHILGYYDYIWKKVREAFAEKFSTSIDYTVFETPEEMVQRVRSNGSDFDLIVTVTFERLGELALARLIQPLNHSYLPKSRAFKNRGSISGT